MTDYTSLLDEELRYRQRAQMDAVGSVNDPPDDAARAMELSRVTGVPAAVIHGDVEGFEQDHKAGLATSIVNNNKFIQDYISQNPLHAKVSNDDWGNLDELSRNIEGYQATKPGTLGPEAIDRIQKGMKTINRLLDPTISIGWTFEDGEWKADKTLDQQINELMKEHPLGVASILDYVAAGVRNALTGPLEAFQGKTVATDPETGMPTPETLERATGTANLMLGSTAFKYATPVNPIKSFLAKPELSRGATWAREISNFVKERQEFEEARARGEDVEPGETYKAFVDKIEPFIKANEVPPPGAHPLTDDMYKEQAKTSAEAFKEVEKSFDGANTTARSPEAAEAFVRTHKDDSLSITADGLKKIYGDEAPEAGDGKLGDVPGVIDGYDAAISSGAPLEVSVPDYLTKVKPELRKELEEDLVHAKDGISVAEGKELGEEKAKEEGPSFVGYHGSPYKFGKFSNENIDTGEGNQAQGRGHYIAENPEVARSYTKVPSGQAVDWNNAENIAAHFLNISDGDRESALDKVGRFLSRKGSDYNKVALGEAKRLLESETEVNLPQGHFYQVKINADPEHFLDLDKSIDEQNDLVKKALESIEAKAEPATSSHEYELPKQLERLRKHLGERPLTGDMFIQLMERAYGPERTTEILQEAGIRGNKYFDQGSRAEEKGTRNYVVFDPSIIEITHTNDVAVQALEAMKAAVGAKPITYYHGTNKKFDIFDPIQLGSSSGSFDAGHGFYFTDDREVASFFADNPKTGRIIEANLDIKNPLTIDLNEFRSSDPMEELRKAATGEDKKGATIKKAFEEGHDAVIFKNSSEGKGPVTTTIVVKSINQIRQRIGEAANRAEPPFKSQYGNWMKKVQAEQEEQASLIRRLHELAVRRRQTKEWKEKAKEIRQQVKEDVKSRPDVALDTFLRHGEIEGEKEANHWIDSDLLTAEQRKGVDPAFFKKDGQDPGEVARYFGYPSVDDLLRGLREAEETRRQHGIGPDQWRKEIIDSEVETRLEEEFGPLEQNILDEVRDFVVSPTTLERVYAELENTAHDAGVTPEAYSSFKRMVGAMFDGIKVGQVSTKKFMNAAGKAGRGIERELLKDKATKGLAAKLDQTVALHMAKEAEKFEKALKSFYKNVKRLSQREPVGIPRDYNYAFHDILHRLGIETEISPEQLKEETARGKYKSLEDFVTKKEEDEYQIMDVPDFMLDPSFGGPLKEMTTEGFYQVHDAIKSMLESARDESKIEFLGEKVDLATKLDDLSTGLLRLPNTSFKASDRGIFANGAALGRRIVAEILQPETLAKRLDLGEFTGPWTQTVAVPAARANGEWNRITTKIADMIAKLPKIRANDLVNNDLFLDEHGKPMKLTNENLVRIMLNAGTDSGWESMVKGEAQYAKRDELDFEYRLVQWIHDKTTPEINAHVEGWFKIFDYAKEENDKMVRAEGKVPIERLKYTTIPTKYGEVRGGYAPIEHDQLRLKPEATEEHGFMEPGFRPVGTVRRFEKQRTGYFAPVRLDMGGLASHLNMQARDTAFRPFLKNARKIIANNDIQNLITAKLGPEYGTMLKEWLRDLGNKGMVDYKNEAAWLQALHFVTNNAIGQFVALNPKTIIKHGSTALIHSMFQKADPRGFLAEMFRYQSDSRLAHVNGKFAYSNSRELPYRSHALIETVGGAAKIVSGRVSKYRAFEEAMAAIALKPFNFVDYRSAEWIWLSEYKKEWKRLVDVEGKDFTDPEVHEKAVDRADYMVRQTHGTLAITSQPAMLRKTGFMRFFTKLMHFFNNMFQRINDIFWTSREAKRAATAGEFKKAFKLASDAIHKSLIWVVATFMIEEAVNLGEHNETWGTKIFRGFTHLMFGGVPIAREVESSVWSRDSVSIGSALTEPAQMAYHGIRNLTKKNAFTERNAGQALQDFGDAVGLITKVPTYRIGRAARFGYNYLQGREHPADSPWSSRTRRSALGGIYHGTTRMPNRR